EQLRSHPFFGDVRELRNVIERAIYLDGDPTDFLGPVAGIPAASGELSTPSPVAPTALPASTTSPQAVSATPVPAPAPVNEALSQASSSSSSLATRSPPAASDFVVELDWEKPFKEAKEQLLERFEAEYLQRV